MYTTPVALEGLKQRPLNRESDLGYKKKLFFSRRATCGFRLGKSGGASVNEALKGDAGGIEQELWIQSDDRTRSEGMFAWWLCNLLRVERGRVPSMLCNCTAQWLPPSRTLTAGDFVCVLLLLQAVSSADESEPCSHSTLHPASAFA